MIYQNARRFAFGLIMVPILALLPPLTGNGHATSASLKGVYTQLAEQQVPAPAPALTAAPAIISVIKRQLIAFRVQDATMAFAQATPTTKAKFPDAERFMAMVNQGYAPLIAPRATAFLPARPLNAERVLQPMALIDSKDKNWIAYYIMERQADGTWKIASCSLKQAPDASV